MIDTKYGRVKLETKPELDGSDEIVFVLRAQDKLASLAVNHYANIYEQATGDMDGSRKIRAIAKQMAAHPGQKLPD